MKDPIEQLTTQADDDLAAVATTDDLERFRIKYLGSKGALKGLMAQLKTVPADQKPKFGQRANAARKRVQDMFDQRKESLGQATKTGSGPVIDVTEPSPGQRLGRSHVITQTMDELIEVFGRMGFDAETGPEVEDEYHNFVALNIPESHPARDPLDNFYIDAAASGLTGGDARLLRSQTSTIQVRVMEQTPPPIRIVAPGRVYRPDEHDATHTSMFHQIEGLYVDRNVSMADLKTTLIQFAHAYFGPEAEVRLRPSFFPFTEPSAELDIKMHVRDKWDWVELGGCGMVDPNVFEAVGYDPEEWTGFAFGLGVERIAMRKHGITDIRWLFENDIRFLKRF
jgi:phenylalanyl-tRNA synthetase alpha chain